MLGSQGLFSIVIETEKRPAETQDKIQKFYQRSNIALSTIILLIQVSYVAPVLVLTDSKEVWEFFKKQYKSMSKKVGMHCWKNINH